MFNFKKFIEYYTENIKVIMLCPVITGHYQTPPKKYYGFNIYDPRIIYWFLLLLKESQPN